MTVQTEKPNAADPALAWKRYEPDDRRPWNLALAGHLYRRAGFGGDWSQLQAALADGPQRTIDKLLQPPDDLATFNRDCDAYAASTGGDVAALRPWWLRRMIGTPQPLLEKMTLFWHGYFAAAGSTVKDARLMRDHVKLLRHHALGDFGAMLQSVSRDPAVLVSLEAGASRKALPNENFARSLMDVFALGPDQATAADVREAARAFTGRFVFGGQFREIPREHDSGTKRVLGRVGNFSGDDVVRIVLDHVATPRSVVRRLYRLLICETDEPDVALIDPLAETFAKNYDVLKLVETLLRSNLFFSATAYRRRIKSPVEFAVGIVRAMEGMVPTVRLAEDLAGLGQNLYHPPTVHGWAGGRHWINRATLPRRHNLALALLQGAPPYGDKLDPQAVAQKHGHETPEAAARFLLDLLLQGDVEPAVRDSLLKTAGGLRRVAYAVVTLPEFHLA
ncbi:MAG: DUF1800 domain-containing protein [Candidatus Nealsonbacteria bacterium]|nr:DUF1800 domain-containing protein [Candidatus Nealsonbacteria bacterium]